MDESGSVGKDEFTKEKNFVKALAGNFQIGPNAAQFGVITYSTGSRLKITLNQYRDLASFQCGLSTIRYAGIIVLKKLFVLQDICNFNLFLIMAK